jgi:hypothetical protein
MNAVTIYARQVCSRILSVTLFEPVPDHLFGLLLTSLRIGLYDRLLLVMRQSELADRR